ncbi:MAG: NADH-quinone oxidoreductase subunit C [Bacteroidia bacterium]|jgi:NADH-quinone oxidoreductase subunit C
MALNNETVLSRLKEQFGDAVLSSYENFDYLNIEIEPSRNAEILRFLKNDAQMNFIYLTDLCAVHMPDQTGKELGVVYHLHNLEENYRLRVKAWLNISNPEIASATSIWKGANWMERETYDFFGVVFTGHPDLRRILNVDHMEVFPLRKEFPLEDSTREDKDDRFFGR